MLSKRLNTEYQDVNYSMVAGHLDGGETAKQCIIREAKEEAGIGLDKKGMEVVHVMHRRNPDREYIDVYLKAPEWAGDIKNMEPEKCGGLKWFPLDQLPENTVPEVKHALECMQNNLAYSEIGWE